MTIHDKLGKITDSQIFVDQTPNKNIELLNALSNNKYINYDLSNRKADFQIQEGVYETQNDQHIR